MMNDMTVYPQQPMITVSQKHKRNTNWIVPVVFSLLFLTDLVLNIIGFIKMNNIKTENEKINKAQNDTLYSLKNTINYSLETTIGRI